MSQGMFIRAPAKLNLHLRVFPKRADGYHNIESIFQQISLFDELYVEIDCNPQSDTNRCKLVSVGMELPPENTVTKAYELFSGFTGIHSAVHIRLTKQIPCGAGMGGGSSDGAAMLCALNKLFAANLSLEQLHTLAEKIGSDVPFFLHGGAALVKGRGERIQKIASRNDIFFVIICPEVYSSTKKAFHLLDECYCTSSTRVNWSAATELVSMYGKPVTEWQFVNSFTEPLTSVFPQIEQALNDIRLSGALFSGMSGSGSAVFGVFSTAAQADRVCSQLSQKWRFCRSTATS